MKLKSLDVEDKSIDLIRRSIVTTIVGFLTVMCSMKIGTPHKVFDAIIKMIPFASFFIIPIIFPFYDMLYYFFITLQIVNFYLVNIFVETAPGVLKEIRNEERVIIILQLIIIFLICIKPINILYAVGYSFSLIYTPALFIEKTCGFENDLLMGDEIYSRGFTSAVPIINFIFVSNNQFMGLIVLGVMCIILVGFSFNDIIFHKSAVSTIFISTIYIIMTNFSMMKKNDLQKIGIHFIYNALPIGLSIAFL